MDFTFWLTILVGLATVIISTTTYYKGKQKEIEADLANKELLEKTNQVVLLQGNLQKKSDSIIDVQNKLRDANEQILVLSNKNVKQVLGDGIPSLSADVWPDKYIVFNIHNNNDYPIYDINMDFPNFGAHSYLENTAGEKSSPWEEMRNDWISIPAFNLPPKTKKKFYGFHLRTSDMNPGLLASLTIGIAARHSAFKGFIEIKRVEQGHVIVECKVTQQKN